MSLDTAPSAASSYARTLVAQGCPEALAQTAAEILAHDSSQQRSSREQAIMAQVWLSITAPVQH